MLCTLAPRGASRVIDNPSLVEAELIAQAVGSRLRTLYQWGANGDLYTEACLGEVPTLVGFVFNLADTGNAREFMQAMGPAYLEQFAAVFVGVMSDRAKVNEYHTSQDLQEWLLYIQEVHKVSVTES